MTDTKPKRFHRYKPETWVIHEQRLAESLSNIMYHLWRERIDAREPGAIAFAPEAK